MTDDELLVLVDGCKTSKEFWRDRLGHKSHATYTKCYKPRLAKLGVVFDKVHYKHSEDEFRKAAEGAFSISDVARKLGLRPFGGGHSTCRDRLKKLGITITPRVKIGKWNCGVQRPIEHYLKKSDLKTHSSWLRKRLIAEGIKENKCEKCGQDSMWCGELLTMQLDHIDGDNKNNELSNLRILCPNCHTQTPTHSAVKTKITKTRTKREPRPNKICSHCESPFYSKNKRRAKYCSVKCGNKASNKIDWPENLPDLVGGSSKLQIAKQLGVTNKAVAKRLLKHHGAVAQE